jgi:hypothetical protein
MKPVLKYTVALGLAGAIGLAMASPSQARHGRNAALIGGLAAGALIGAAAANANNGYYYGGGPYYGPSYGYYAPGYYDYGYAYEPAPVYSGPTYYRGYRGYYGSDVNERATGSYEGNTNLTP